MNKKERLEPLSLWGLDLKVALHAMLSVDSRKLKLQEEQEKDNPEVSKSTKTAAIKRGD